MSVLLEHRQVITVKIPEWEKARRQGEIGNIKCFRYSVTLVVWTGLLLSREVGTFCSTSDLGTLPCQSIRITPMLFEIQRLEGNCGVL